MWQKCLVTLSSSSHSLLYTCLEAKQTIHLLFSCHFFPSPLHVLFLHKEFFVYCPDTGNGPMLTRRSSCVFRQKRRQTHSKAFLAHNATFLGPSLTRERPRQEAVASISWNTHTHTHYRRLLPLEIEKKNHLREGKGFLLRRLLMISHLE